MPNEIDKAKKKAIEALKEKAGEMSTAAYSILLETIENTFDIQAGKIVVDKNFIKQLNKLTVSVLDLLQKEPKFTGPVSSFVKRLSPISEAITDFQKQTNGVKVPAYETAKRVVVDEVIDQMLNNGLNQNFVLPLRDLMYQSVEGGLTLSAAKAQIRDFIKGGGDTTGKLGKYIDQTSQQAVDSYSGIINKNLMKEFDYDGLLMTGSLIDNSSPQCKYVVNELGGRISEKDWPKVKEIAEKNGLMENTTFENLPLNKLHWGCRHSFYPIILKKSE